jgi:hypothetical protein
MVGVMGVRRIDCLFIGLVGLVVAGLWVFRAIYVEPVAWGARCALAGAPLGCLPRAGLLWLQQTGLWGGLALVLGVWAFVGRQMLVGVAAVLLGVAAVIDYNATWGMLGMALGGWVWIMSVPGGRTSKGSAGPE